jgi:hypothetical protein
VSALIPSRVVTVDLSCGVEDARVTSAPCTSTAGSNTGSSNGQYVYYSNWFKNPGYRRIKVGQTHSEVVVDLKDLHEFAPSWSGLTLSGAALFVRDVSSDEISLLFRQV